MDENSYQVFPLVWGYGFKKFFQIGFSDICPETKLDDNSGESFFSII